MMYLMSYNKYENLKKGCTTCNDRSSDQKNYYKQFSYTFLQCNRSRKNDYFHWTPENVAFRRILTELAVLFFRRV